MKIALESLRFASCPGRELDRILAANGSDPAECDDIVASIFESLARGGGTTAISQGAALLAHLDSKKHSPITTAAGSECAVDRVFARLHDLANEMDAASGDGGTVLREFVRETGSRVAMFLVSGVFTPAHGVLHGHLSSTTASNTLLSQVSKAETISLALEKAEPMLDNPALQSLPVSMEVLSLLNTLIAPLLMDPRGFQRFAQTHLVLIRRTMRRMEMTLATAGEQSWSSRGPTMMLRYPPSTLLGCIARCDPADARWLFSKVGASSSVSATQSPLSSESLQCLWAALHFAVPPQLATAALQLVINTVSTQSLGQDDLDSSEKCLSTLLYVLYYFCESKPMMLLVASYLSMKPAVAYEHLADRVFTIVQNLVETNWEFWLERVFRWRYVNGDTDGQCEALSLLFHPALESWRSKEDCIGFPTIALIQQAVSSMQGLLLNDFIAFASRSLIGICDTRLDGVKYWLANSALDANSVDEGATSYAYTVELAASELTKRGNDSDEALELLRNCAQKHNVLTATSWKSSADKIRASFTSLWSCLGTAEFEERTESELLSFFQEVCETPALRDLFLDVRPFAGLLACLHRKQPQIQSLGTGIIAQFCGSYPMHEGSPIYNMLSTHMVVPALIQKGLSLQDLPDSLSSDGTKSPTEVFVVRRLSTSLAVLAQACSCAMFRDQAVSVLAGSGPTFGLASVLSDLAKHEYMRKASLMGIFDVRAVDKTIFACAESELFKTHMNELRLLDRVMLLTLAVGMERPPSFLREEIKMLLQICRGHPQMAHRVGRNIMRHFGRYADGVKENKGGRSEERWLGELLELARSLAM
ncbi:hypothetical protein DFJ73DRAFT_865942, partial [Zopfochytrium polystomum]